MLMGRERERGKSEDGGISMDVLREKRYARSIREEVCSCAGLSLRGIMGCSYELLGAVYIE